MVVRVCVYMYTNCCTRLGVFRSEDVEAPLEIINSCIIIFFFCFVSAQELIKLLELVGPLAKEVQHLQISQLLCRPWFDEAGRPVCWFTGERRA